MKDKQTNYYWPLESSPPGSNLWTPFTGRIQSFGYSNYHFLPSCFSTHIITAGEGTVIFNGTASQVKQGSMFTLWPGYEIKYYDNENNPWSYLFFRLDGKSTEGFLRNCGITPENPVVNTACPEKAIACFEKIYECCKTQEPGQEYLLVSTLLSLPQYCLAIQRKQRKPLDLTEQTADLIESKLTTGININEICELLKVSRVTLFREFKYRMGISPICFLTRKRLEKAKELLQTTDKNLDEITVLSGFNSKSYFCKVFKKSTGQTPNQFRQLE